jgi:hypothetical protein
MVFTHDKDADYFNPLSYGNLRGLEDSNQSASFTEMNSGDASSDSNFTGKLNFTCKEEKCLNYYLVSHFCLFLRSWKGEHI